jgi:hypothetical protein
MLTRYTLREDIGTDKLHTIEFTNGVTARNIMLEFVFHSDDLTVTPELLSWNIKASVKFDFREVITLAVRVGDRVPSRSNNRSPHTATEIRSTLRTLRALRGETISYRDYRGYNFDNVRILTGFQESDVVDDKYRSNETVMTVRILRVSEADGNAFIVEQSIVAGPDVVVEG